jgi:hypothetical protein
MPNHVSNRIEIVCTQEQADDIFKRIGTEGQGAVDFETLIPTPAHIYQGDLGAVDEEDFRGNDWNTWNRANWGTKWNAYSASVAYDEGRAIIKFDTAWSISYPFVIAIANTFVLPFTFKYFDEGHNFWGIETWGLNKFRSIPTICRTSKKYKEAEDLRPLCIELKGYDPDKEDDED